MDVLKMLDTAIWYVIGDDIFFIAGGMLALGFMIAVLLLIAGLSRGHRVG